MVYYVASSLDVSGAPGRRPSYIIPAGNLGNAFAAVWARALGFPIGRIILAHNANRTVPDFLHDRQWQPRPSIATLASAMDVGNPSNMERIRALYPTIDSMREHLSADSVDDATIRARIGEDFMHYGREWCPHTATAAEVYSRLSAAWIGAVIPGCWWPRRIRPNSTKWSSPSSVRPVDVPDSLDRLLRCLDTLWTCRRPCRLWPQRSNERYLDRAGVDW
jgi:threonine synthase